VYGFPCEVEKIEQIAKKHNLRVIYDAAHAFGVKYKGESLLNYGDVSTLSFHATKLFHTVEGGAIVSNDTSLNQKIFNLHAFGHLGDEYFSVGVNAKNSEFHAAMGLCNLPTVHDAIAKRKTVADSYISILRELPLQLPKIAPDIEYNYAYFPIIFENEKILLHVKKSLEAEGVNTRRYFYPSLNKLPYITSEDECPVSEDISRRVLCLPFYQQLTDKEISKISAIIIKATLKKL
jgi:dTDP-4-amino-4,6-dideoxygalactose transaminase